MLNKISVITVTFNAAATLERTILSVKAQSYQHVEFIIIDGKSTDGTLAIIDKYRQQIAHCASEPDDGIYDAMNKAIDAATGDWVLFLGADDCFYSTTVLTDIFAGKNYDGVDFLYGNVELTSNKKLFGGPKDYEKLLIQNICHQAIFYRRELLLRKKKFNDRYKILADYDFNLRAFRDDNIQKKYIPATVTFFNDKGVSNYIIDRAFFVDWLNYLSGVERRPGKDPAIQQYFFYSGFIHLNEGKITIGVKQVIHSIIYGKRKLFHIRVALQFLLSFIGIGKKIRYK